MWTRTWVLPRSRIQGEGGTGGFSGGKSPDINLQWHAWAVKSQHSACTGGPSPKQPGGTPPGWEIAPTPELASRGSASLIQLAFSPSRARVGPTHRCSRHPHHRSRRHTPLRTAGPHPHRNRGGPRCSPQGGKGSPGQRNTGQLTKDGMAGRWHWGGRPWVWGGSSWVGKAPPLLRPRALHLAGSLGQIRTASWQGGDGRPPGPLAPRGGPVWQTGAWRAARKQRQGGCPILPWKQTAESSAPGPAGGPSFPY